MLAYKIECLIHPVIKKGWHNGRLLENIELFKSDSIRHGHTYLKINVVFGVSEKCEIKDNILQCPYLLVFGPVFLRFRQTSLGLFFPWQPGKWDSGAHGNSSPTLPLERSRLCSETGDHNGNFVNFHLKTYHPTQLKVSDVA